MIYAYGELFTSYNVSANQLGRSFFENFPNSCLIISCFQDFIQVGFYFLGKKLGGHGPPWPLPLLRHCKGHIQTFSYSSSCFIYYIQVLFCRSFLIKLIHLAVRKFWRTFLSWNQYNKTQANKQPRIIFFLSVTTLRSRCG